MRLVIKMTREELKDRTKTGIFVDIAELLISNFDKVMIYVKKDGLMTGYLVTKPKDLEPIFEHFKTVFDYIELVIETIES